MDTSIPVVNTSGIYNYLQSILGSVGITNKHLKDLHGTTLAIDISNLIYKFMRRHNWILELINFIHKFSKYNITLIFVYDGIDPDKTDTRQHRKTVCSKNIIKLLELENKLDASLDASLDSSDPLNDSFESTNDEIEYLSNEIVKVSLKTKHIKPEHIIESKALFDILGIQYIHIKNIEADKLLVELCKHKNIYGCYTEDTDMLAYGCKNAIWGLDFKCDTVKVNNYEDILMQLQKMHITEFILLNAIIASGTDYNNAFIHSKKFKDNLKLIAEWGSIQAVIDNLYLINKDRDTNIITIPKKFDYKNTLDIFRKELHNTIQYEIYLFTTKINIFQTNNTQYVKELNILSKSKNLIYNINSIDSNGKYLQKLSQFYWNRYKVRI